MAEEAKKEYGDSAEFTDEFYTVLEIVTSERWKDWMKVSDDNWGTNVQPQAEKIEKAILDIDKQFDEVN